MIFDAIISVFVVAIETVLGFGPEWTPPDFLALNPVGSSGCTIDTVTNAGCGAQVIGGKMTYFNWWLPIRELFTVLPAIFQLTVALFTFRMLLRMWAMVRGGGD